MAIATHVTAQSGNMPSNQQFIDVTGYASTEVMPDEIYISFAIREKYVKGERVSIESQESKLRAHLTMLGIDISNLKLSDTKIDYEKIGWNTKEILAKKEFVLKVADVANLRLVFQKLEEITIADAYISKVAVSAIDSIKKAVRLSAMKDAKEKADYLLSALGEQTGKVLIVQEQNFAAKQISDVHVRGQSSAGTTYFIDGVQFVDKVDIEEDLAFRKIKVEASFFVKFAVK
ncbi:MAG: SIMPL domain-containing protein [Saprospiraceae bacterium]